MPLPRFGIGARFRIERCLMVLQDGAEALGQLFQHVIRREADPACLIIGLA